LPKGNSVFFSSWSSSFRILRTPHEMSSNQIMRLDGENNANGGVNTVRTAGLGTMVNRARQMTYGQPMGAQ
jgi:hypothetical protein